MKPLLVSFIALAGSSVLAQPAFFEPPSGYYKAKGPRVIASWAVDRTTLPEDGILTATLTIEGASNPQEIIRPDLARIREFADRFQIENVAGRAPIFAYKLRPRNAQVNRLPSMDFFYDSGVKVGDPFKNARVRGIDLVVTPVEKPKPPVAPLLEPDRLFEIETGSRVLVREPFAAGWASWLGLFLLGGLAPVLWYAAWRRVYPDGARLAKLRRNRALRRALDALDRAGSARDVASAVLGYLRSRHPLAAGCETPSEVGEALRTAGFPDSDAVAEFLRRCDAARFSTASDTAMSLADEARILIARVEAAA